MNRWGRLLWLLPLLLGVLLWWRPPLGDDAYYHAIASVEHVRAWEEGALLPRYHRAWNGGTGSFLPTVYAPIPLAIQGGLAWLTGDGQRAVGLSLALALLTAAVVLAQITRSRWAAVLLLTPYLLAVALSRATTTEAWALAGAAVVLGTSLPPGVSSRRRGLALASGVALVSGSQLGMLLQLAWLLVAAWLVAGILRHRGHWPSDGPLPVAAATSLAWAAAGLLAASVLWLPAVVDGAHLALGEALTGDLSWRVNFLPGASPLTSMLGLAAVAVAAFIAVLLVRGSDPRRLAPAAAMVAGLLLATAAAAPAWALPGMAYLQFPWRFLGPVTLVAVLSLTGLAGRRRWLGAALLVLPSLLLPLRLDPTGGGVPVSTTPAGLARIAEAKWGLPPILPSARGFYAPGFHRLASLQELHSQPVTIEELRRSASGGSWRVTAAGPTMMLLPLQWWPEWRLTVNGEPAAYTNRSGLVEVMVGGGTSEVRASLGRSRSRALGGVLSLAGLLMLAGLAVIGRRSTFFQVTL